eukprot:Skav205338  [mRNA]  locus=scaffold3444:501111:505274:- [translate_table: standard]
MQVHTTALQRTLTAAGASKLPMGFDSWPMTQAIMEPANDMWDHWNKSAQAVHPLLRDPKIEPGALAALQHSLRLHGELPAFRAQVVVDLRDLVDEWSDDTAVWFDQVPSHVATVYRSSLAGFVQIPVLLYLLSQCGYPGLAELRDDLTFGFKVIGQIHPGAGWLPRLDTKYAFPISVDQLNMRNQEHIQTRWSLLHFDLHPLVPVLLRVATDIEYALVTAVDDILPLCQVTPGPLSSGGSGQGWLASNPAAFEPVTGHEVVLGSSLQRFLLISANWIYAKRLGHRQEETWKVSHAQVSHAQVSPQVNSFLSLGCVLAGLVAALASASPAMAQRNPFGFTSSMDEEVKKLDVVPAWQHSWRSKMGSQGEDSLPQQQQHQGD